jgi:hypothetical protein
LPRQHRADVTGEACDRPRQRDFHRPDGVALQRFHHFQLEAADAILRGARVYGMDAAGQVLVRRQPKRRFVLPFFEKLPPFGDVQSDCRDRLHG